MTDESFSAFYVYFDLTKKSTKHLFKWYSGKVVLWYSGIVV